MKHISLFSLVFLMYISVLAEDCTNDKIYGFTTNYLSYSEICLEEACVVGTDFHIEYVKMIFHEAIHILDDKCFRYRSLPGFTGIEDGFARVCNDIDECSDIPLCFVVGTAPNCLPELIEIEVAEGATAVEVCLDDYCSELADLQMTVLNPPIFAFDPLTQGEGFCVDYYALPGLIGTESFDIQICNDESNTYCDTLTLAFNVGNPTSILDFETKNWIEITSNPVKEILQFSLLEEATLTNHFTALLYDVSGKIVLQKTFETNTSNKTFEWDLAQLESGMYFFGIEGKQGAHRILLQD